MQCLKKLLVVVLSATRLCSASLPYTGLTGSPKASMTTDNCWSNVTLDAKGRRALIVTTSHGDELSNGKKSGLALQEASAPYYVYLGAGMTVDIASILGGVVPVGASSRTSSQSKFKQDATAQSKMNNSLRIADVDFADYDVVFMAGGWGAAFDLGFSTVLGAKVAGALAAQKPLIGSTCHGALGFVQANQTNGTNWAKGRTMTGVTDAQIQKLGVKDQTPMHPEEELRALGANYQSIHGAGLRGDVGATSVAVDTQGPIIVTGQNQNSACLAAQRQLLFLAALSDKEARVLV